MLVQKPHYFSHIWYCCISRLYFVELFKCGLLWHVRTRKKTKIEVFQGEARATRFGVTLFCIFFILKQQHCTLKNL